MKIAFADETDDVASLIALISAGCDEVERGLWPDGAEPGVAAMIRNRELVVVRDDEGVVGTVRVRRLSGEHGEFGMLVVDPYRRGAGLGRQLVAFAERWARDLGLSFLQVELRVPRASIRPRTEFLRAWYARAGYRAVRTARAEERYPELRPLLPLVSTVWDVVIYRKEIT